MPASYILYLYRRRWGDMPWLYAAQTPLDVIMNDNTFDDLHELYGGEEIKQDNANT